MRKVTVLLSVYNSEKYLDKCLEGLWEQTYKDFEVVCVDDCSTDSSPKIVKEWQEKFGDNYFKVIRNKRNLGLTRSLNLGLSRISTKYTARLDDDDIWEPSKLQKQISFLIKNSSYVVIGCNYKNEYEGKIIPVVMPETDKEIRNNIVKRNPFAHSCVIFDTKLVLKAGGYDGRVKYGQDYDLWFRLLNQGKMYNIQEFLCVRKLGVGISEKKMKSQMWQCIKTRIKYINNYHYSKIEYLSVVELLMMIIMPLWLIKLKRRLVK